MPVKDYETISVFSAAKMGHESCLGDNRMIYNPQGLIPCHVTENGKRKAKSVYGSRPSHKDVIVRHQCNYPRMVIDFPNQSEECATSKRIHPTQKPINLLRYLIKTYTYEDAVVLDNCIGSGSTAIACIREKRHFIGFELDKNYYKKSLERIENEKRQLTLF